MQINFENLTMAFLPRRPGSMRPSGSTSARACCRSQTSPMAAFAAMARADVTRVRFVKSAQRLGFIGRNRRATAAGGWHPLRGSRGLPSTAQGCAREDGRLARMEAVLSELVCACHARKGNVSCPLRYCKTERSSLHRRGGVTGNVSP
jgi:MerR family mercuric resistance operon transcriptional regulator